MAEKVTVMRLKVNLQCHKCYKKVKNVLCNFPQIRNQEYDDKKNMVTITVVCCNPEKIRDKLCCKGCGAITSIEIVEPPTPPPSRPPSPPPPPVCRPPAVLIGICCGPCRPAVPIRTCCGPCSEGRPGGPCFHCCGGSPACYEPCYVYGSYGEGRPCYVSNCGEYSCEENPSACSIM